MRTIKYHFTSEKTVAADYPNVECDKMMRLIISAMKEQAAVQLTGNPGEPSFVINMASVLFVEISP